MTIGFLHPFQKESGWIPNGFLRKQGSKPASQQASQPASNNCTSSDHSLGSLWTTGGQR